ncbi:hypothetical protein F66182_6167 [Fusarium sp. NRRL 66182]|nr:hypothetical protein F66182_6167 [Fusarium sp. NRRL 66182]
MPQYLDDDYDNVEPPRQTSSLPYRDAGGPANTWRHRDHGDSPFDEAPRHDRTRHDAHENIEYGHPAKRTYLNPDSPVKVLLVGPSQNGKTTFINRLIKIAANKVEMGKEGNKTKSCTAKVTEYYVEVPTSDYMLVDKETSLDFEVPDLAMDEEKILSGNRWKKMTSVKYNIRLQDPNAPYLKLHLIDTPGLDDSKGRDFENMEDVLSTLNRHAQSKEPWMRQLNAIVLVYNANNAFSSSFQDIIKYYHQCMPNLFGTMAVVNTHFDLVNLSQKRQHLIRDGFLNKTDNARRRILKGRAEDFKKLHGQGLDPTHFFIDNRPPERSAYAELLSRNTISDIIMYLHASTDSPMPITQMRIVKSQEMQTIDAKLQRGLEVAISSWSETLAEIRASDATNAVELLRSEIQQNKEFLSNAIARCSADLSRWDNDTRWELTPHMTSHSPSGAKLFFKGSIFRQKITGTINVTEDEHDEFWVTTHDGPTGSWLDYHWETSPRKWIGNYEGKPGKSPSLLAKSWTTNRVKYKNDIAKARRELRAFEATLAEKEKTWEQKFSKIPATSKTDTDRKLEELVSWIETSKHLAEILSQKSPPIDTGFNAAARRRYGKLPSQIGTEDLYEFVRAAALDFELVKPLKRVGLEDYDL